MHRVNWIHAQTARCTCITKITTNTNNDLNSALRTSRDRDDAQNISHFIFRNKQINASRIQLSEKNHSVSIEGNRKMLPYFNYQIRSNYSVPQCCNLNNGFRVVSASKDPTDTSTHGAPNGVTLYVLCSC